MVNNRSQPDLSPPPQLLVQLVAQSGVQFNGTNPWDIQIFDRSVYRRILSHGGLGFGETYMDGLWECDSMDEMVERLLRIDSNGAISNWIKIRLLFDSLRFRLLNRQTHQHSTQVIEQHYEAGIDLFSAMLDSSMSYSCAYWQDADNLEQAQQAKLELICRKLELKAGETLLDIGCGWGGLLHYAATNYGVIATGVTLSPEQAAVARQRCSELPVTIIVGDYRELSGSYDKIVSVGMFEHVGHKNYPHFFNLMHRLLHDEGLFLLHTIGYYTSGHNSDAWMDKYIFPGGQLPSAQQLTLPLDGLFLIEDWHNFGHDYARTLMAWWQNFHRAWPNQLQHHYSERFYRMWRYYLMCSIGMFRSRQGHLWQLILTKRERSKTYRSLR